MMGVLVSLGSLALLLGGSLLVLFQLVRRRSSPPAAGAPLSPELRVVRRAGVGPRQGVVLLLVGSRHLLVSCGEGGVRLLAEVDGDEGIAHDGSPPVDQDLHEAVRRLRTADGGRTARRDGVGVRRWLSRTLASAGLFILLTFVAAAVGPGELWAQVDGAALSASPEASLPELDIRLGGSGEEGGLRVSGPVGAVLVIGFLTLIPTLLLLTTSFTRILIVLHLLKQALGAQAAPPAHIVTALALLLSAFVMAPTLSEVNEHALAPWMAGAMDEVEMLRTASGPVRDFMMTVIRDEDLALFLDLWRDAPSEAVEETPFLVVASAFVTSELRTAFQMGFALFLPFIVIDLVVASVLMSMGMFMLPPLMVSLPFKLLLFVLVDGWSLVVGSIVQSFH